MGLEQEYGGQGWPTMETTSNGSSIPSRTTRLRTGKPMYRDLIRLRQNLEGLSKGLTGSGFAVLVVLDYWVGLRSLWLIA